MAIAVACSAWYFTKIDLSLPTATPSNPCIGKQEVKTDVRPFVSRSAPDVL
jgi:hypothetical protein